ncbi:hypothetical protein [Phormidium tenue]|uniref:hypothetical protein n=1 Tax=Phormidium tenue TaxID=126344 RepID=UPI00111529B2|nr:hypothetical protein [Phormidium tenue]MBD2232089.1 hypothetical protein [Phormidium tenue FACHB-1052]
MSYGNNPGRCLSHFRCLGFGYLFGKKDELAYGSLNPFQKGLLVGHKKAFKVVCMEVFRGNSVGLRNVVHALIVELNMLVGLKLL